MSLNKSKLLTFIILFICIIVGYIIMALFLRTTNPREIGYYVMNRTWAIDSVFFDGDSLNEHSMFVSLYAHNNINVPLVIDSFQVIDSQMQTKWESSFWILTVDSVLVYTNRMIAAHKSFYLKILVRNPSIVGFRNGSFTEPIDILIYSHHAPTYTSKNKSFQTTYNVPKIWFRNNPIVTYISMASKTSKDVPMVYPIDKGTYWSISKDYGILISTENSTEIIDTLFVDSDKNESEEDTTESFPYYFKDEHRPLSLVGPFLSYEYSYEGSGGVHPICGTNYSTIDLRSKREVPLDRLFPEADIVRSLLGDTLIIKSLSIKDTTSLSIILQNLDGGCEISFFDMLKHYRFGEVNGDSIDIQFGLPHGCEVMRGNFTTFTIRLAIPDTLVYYAKRIQYY